MTADRRGALVLSFSITMDAPSAPAATAHASTTSTPSTAWHVLEAGEVAERLRTSPHGLSAAEVDARRERYGSNRLEEVPPPSALAVLLHQFTSPLIYVLLAATLVTAWLEEYIDAGVIAVVLILNAVIGFTQERRAERSVRALMGLVAPRARVIRDGRETEVDSQELVPGDVVLLESGVRVPADLRLFTTTALDVDESLLTGESLPVTKAPPALRVPELPLADRTNSAYMGAIVASGRGRGYVVAIGGETALGAIALSMRAEEKVETPLQQRMTRFAHVVALAVGISAVAAFGAGILVRGESSADMFLVAVALAVAAVPEGLPVVFTITLALGVRRMARRHAIVRQLPAVETLGSTTVIGSDKTGTLTENRMTVQQIWAGGRWFLLGGARPDGVEAIAVDTTTLAEHHPLYFTLLAGVLTNEAQVHPDGERFDIRGDPTEAALLVAAFRLGLDPNAARDAHELQLDVPFEPARQYSASVRQRDGAPVLFVKGAPERVLEMCSRQMSDSGDVPLNRQAVLDAAHGLAARGLRVLAMAERVHPKPGPPGEVGPSIHDLTFLGLQGMMDPPRDGVHDAILGCQEAGVRVVMITGDHAETARAIGRALDISQEGEVLTGSQMATMDAEELARRTDEVSIYARVAPDQKLRIVRALRARGEVVAVTGDGVNDAPALKAADIGIAMGRSGTDVAREAAHMVLADDNFVSIYAAVEEGRVTFDNVRKVTFFLISTGAAAILMILTAMSLGWPLPMLPAQLLWLNLVTNGLQDVALAFEPGEPGVLRQPPRPRREGILSALLWERTLVTGVVMAAGTLLTFQWAFDRTASLEHARTVALTTMVLFQMFHVGNVRSERLSVFQKSPLSNPFLFVATAAALVAHVAALHWGPTQFVLRVAPIPWEEWGGIILVAMSIVVVVELHKLLRRGSRGRSQVAG